MKTSAVSFPIFLIITVCKFQAGESQDLTFESALTDLITTEFDTCEIYLVDLVFSSPRQQVCEEKDRRFPCYPTTTISSILNEIVISRSLQPIYVAQLDHDNNRTIDYSGYKSTRKTAQCAFLTALATTVENEDLPKVAEKLSTHFIPIFDEVTRKDEDHYVFYSRPDNAEAILRSSITKELKFKLSFYYSEQSLLKAKTLAFYPSPGTIRDIPLKEDRSLEKLYPDFTKHGCGHQLEMTIPIRILFLYEISQDGGKWVGKRGMYKPFMDDVLEGKLNFTVNQWPSSFGGGTGTMAKNGTWNGGVRDLVDKKADIEATSSLNLYRFKFVGSTKPLVYLWVNFATGLPKASYSWNAIYTPLSGTIWFFTALSMAFTVGMFKLIQKFHHGRSADVFNRHHWSHLIMPLLGQGVEDPHASLTRSLFTTWLFMVIIVATAYTTKLVELMAFPILDLLPKNFAELGASKLSWGLEENAAGGSAYHHFRSSSNIIYKTIHDKMSIEKDAVGCFRKAIESNFACITYHQSTEYLYNRNFSSGGSTPFVSSEDLTVFVASGFLIQERALFRITVDYYLDNVREMGLAERWKQEDEQRLRQGLLEWEKALGIKHKRQDGPDTLTLQHLKGPYVVLTIGLSTAGVVLSEELFGSKFPLATVARRAGLTLAAAAARTARFTLATARLVVETLWRTSQPWLKMKK